MKVEDVMTRDVRTVLPGQSLKDVAALLSEHGIGGVPVVDEGGSPLGVVSKADIMIKERAEVPRSGGWWIFGRDDAGAAAKVTARTAGEAMSAPPITTDPALPVSLAAARMLDEGVNRLLVVRRGALVGIIARHDLVCAFARNDAEIEQEILADAARELSWPDALQVSVHDGEVTLRGEVDSVFDAKSLPELVRQVLGVVSVDSQLRGWDPQRQEHVAVAAHL